MHTASAIVKTDNQLYSNPSKEINFQFTKCATQLFHKTRLIKTKRADEADFEVEKMWWYELINVACC